MLEHIVRAAIMNFVLWRGKEYPVGSMTELVGREVHGEDVLRCHVEENSAPRPQNGVRWIVSKKLAASA